jgi:sugar phosphate isomerase/epimerase
MYLSALLTSLPLEFEPAARQVAALGFAHVDLVARGERPPADREALAEAGLLVSCAALGKDLPQGVALDAESPAHRREALEQVRRQIADAAQLGATHAYLVAGADITAAGLARFTEACALLADYAGGRMLRLCVEHLPARGLPTAASVLDWLEQVGHPNLALLLDVGHCLLSGEEPARVVERAGERLGYVHLDDNDGRTDLHWPLLRGRLTEEGLRSFLAALDRSGYGGALALELNPTNPDPTAALAHGKELIERLLGGL